MQMSPRDPELLRRLGHAELPGDDLQRIKGATVLGFLQVC